MLLRGNRNLCGRIVRQKKNLAQVKQSSMTKPSSPSLIIQQSLPQQHLTRNYQQILISGITQQSTPMYIGCERRLSYVSLESSSTKDELDQEAVDVDETSFDSQEQEVSSSSSSSSSSSLDPKHYLSLMNSTRRNVKIEPMPDDFEDINNEIILTFQGVWDHGLFWGYDVILCKTREELLVRVRG